MNPTTEFFRTLSPQDFAAFGVNDIAYVKQVRHPGGTGFAIHAADGTPLTIVANLPVAVATVRQHEMEPVSVH